MGLMDLFRPAWKHSSPRVRVKAAESLDDQAVLAELAMLDPSAEVRGAAGRRLSDPDRLAAVARHICAKEGYRREREDRDLLTRVAERTGDLHLLEEIARTGDYTATNRLRLAELSAALWARKDLPPELLEELTATDARVRSQAVERLNDQVALEDVARLEPESNVLEVVAGRLSSQEALAALARRETWNSVRAAAAARLSDPAVLTEILRDDDDPRVRPAVISRLMELGDQPTLAKAATTLEGEAGCRAAWALRDPALLAAVVREARSEPVRAAARKRLEGGDSLPGWWMPLVLHIGEAVDIATRGCQGIPWDADPGASAAAWQTVIPGSYVLAKIEDGWAYLRSGETRLKLDADDLQMYGMQQGWIA